MNECKSVFEYEVACFFRGECEEGEVLVELWLGKAHEFVLFAGVVTFPYNGLEDVECVLMSKSFPLEVQSKVMGFGDELIPFLYLTDDRLSIFHFQDECLVTLEECMPVTLRVLKVYLYEAYPFFGDGVGPDVNWIRVCCTKWDVHLFESLKTIISRFLPTNALKTIVKTNGNMESFR